MLKAKDITSLLEIWKKTSNGHIEILVNSKSWQEAVSDFKDDLYSMRRTFGDKTQYLRFTYNPDNDKLWVWLAYYAIHMDVGSLSKSQSHWFGAIDLDNRIARVEYPRGMNRKGEQPLDMQELPERLARFLMGLSLQSGAV